MRALAGPTLAALLAIGLSACGGSAQVTAEEPTPAPDPQVEPARTDRSLRAMGHGAEVRLDEGTGPLIDSNAPPPPPGYPIYRHPAVHGSCHGDLAGCSRAGNLVRAATTFDAVVSALAADGFECVVR